MNVRSHIRIRAKTRLESIRDLRRIPFQFCRPNASALNVATGIYDSGRNAEEFPEKWKDSWNFDGKNEK